MEIRQLRINVLYSPLFWTILCILSSSFCEDVSSVPKTQDGNVPQNISVVTDNSDALVAATTVNIAAPADPPPTADNTNEKVVVSDNVVSASGELKGSDVVQSSFEEPPEATTAGEGTFAFAEVASQNSGIPNEITDGGQGIVVTLVDTASAELKQRAEQSSQKEQESATNNNVINTTETNVPIPPTIVEEETLQQNDTIQQENAEKLDLPKIEPKENLTEEIPSFSEWAQKQLEEAEKKREEVNSSTQNQNINGRNTSSLRVRSKNYASPDCGAKIAAANPEAVSPSSVLSPSRDEYKLNTCTSRIWFIVELCEAVQAKRIDLANFELFSSSPKDFSVSVSDRFPSREWSNVGNFQAKDERDIQSFDLKPLLFGKYIKVELHSHHGSEHFCPISLFRVYGTSEFEVLEKEDQQHENDDDDDDEAVDSEKGQGSPKNLFSAASDAVISMVKKAAEVLGNKRNVSNQTNEEEPYVKYSPLISTCTTPSHIVVCDNCSDVLFGKVYELLSCKVKFLDDLLVSSVIKQTLYNTDVCLQYGLDFQSKKNMEVPNIYQRYVKSFFPQHNIAALCNTVAIIESKVVLNISKQLNTTREIIKESTIKTEPIETLHITETMLPIKTEEIEATEAIVASKIDVSTITEAASDISYISQIKPTKTLTPDQMIELTHYISRENSLTETVKPTQTLPEIVNTTQEDELSVENITEIIEEATTESAENLELEHLINDLTNENNTHANSATPSPPQLKESVFLRLSNRIKTLERNMSLSSQYLEELSRRYKKQVEEMQRLLEKTITTLNEESKRKDERNELLEEKINHLTDIVEALVREKNNSFNPLNWLFLVVLSMFGIFTFCRRSEHKHPNPNGTTIEIQRRKSIDVITHHSPTIKERRPSEEALKISGTYEHLLIDDMRKRYKEKRRKKKRILPRSNSITNLNETIINRQTSMPGTFPVDWDDGSIKNGIEDIPFVLEESDNNPLQDLPLPKPLQEVDIKNLKIKPLPIRKISSPAFLKSTEIRRSAKFNGVLNRMDVLGHKKSASVDETKRKKSPAPSTTGTVSLNITFDEPPTITPTTTNINNVQKKEKKGTFKKIFKKVF